MHIRGVFLIVTGLVAFTGSPSARAQVVLLPGSSSFAASTTSPPLPPAPGPSNNGVSAASGQLPATPPTAGAYIAPPHPHPEMFPPVGYAPVQTMAPCACADSKPSFFTPYMLGDFVGPVANQFSDVKIAEGESPRPIDRVFYKFN